jgi:hypothetical protein
MLRWDRYGLPKKHTGTHYAEQLFLHPVKIVGHVVHSSAYGVQNVNAQVGLVCIAQKKCAVTCYAEPVFFHPAGSMGHVVYSGVSGERHVNTIYFLLGWD